MLAAAGSAVGLGNLWKFPYIAWSNKGGGFVLVYLVCILIVGLPMMLAEILIGRMAQTSSVPAFEKLGGRHWAKVGWLGVITGMVILSFYAVIAGWSISSFTQCLNWSVMGYEAPGEHAFGAFLANGWLQVGLTLLFSAATAVIVMGGISGGIEKATKILMPVLFVIMLFLVLTSISLDGSGKAMAFLFTPDFSHFEWQGVLEALGHAFFTLSLGMGAMITYGSYMSKKESIKNATIAIVILDTVIALMACIIMYSIIFSYPEIESQVGRSAVGMLFTTLPQLFYTKLAMGKVIGPVFYVLVGFAALTSTISLLEVVVSLMVDKLNVPRLKATLLSASGIFLVSVACALSLGANGFLTNFKPFGRAEAGFLHQLNDIFFANKAGVLSILDHFSANWLLPLGGFFITLFVGWFIESKLVMNELDMADTHGRPRTMYKLFQFIVRFVAPAVIALIIIQVIRGADFS